MGLVCVQTARIAARYSSAIRPRSANDAPTELFRRNCWISFEPVEGCLSALADYIGPHKILWATDYPHPDGFFPGAPKLIMDRPELSAATKRAIMGGGARGFYKLEDAR